jgi:hypothetical protein
MLNCFGFKIVEKSRPSIEPLVERALREGRPLEVGLYYNDREALDYLTSRLPTSQAPVVAHLNHRRLDLFNLALREQELHDQLALAASLGAASVITHVALYPMTPRPEQHVAMVERLCAGLESMAVAAAGYGLRVHLENTFHGLGFYRTFFQQAAAAGLGPAHCCFDLGHARVWSTETLTQWCDFLAGLAATGSRLHVHLHANRGLYDDHLAFHTARRLGITGADGFTGGIDDLQVLALITARFPQVPKVFEVPAAEALENLDFVLEHVGAVLGSADTDQTITRPG